MFFCYSKLKHLISSYSFTPNLNILEHLPIIRLVLRRNGSVQAPLGTDEIRIAPKHVAVKQTRVRYFWIKLNSILPSK